MPELTFPQFQNEFFQRHNSQDYAGALSLLDRHAGEFSNRANYTTQWRMCAQTLSGDPSGALQTFQAALDDGLWWPADVMVNDPDLASLQSAPAFRAMVTRCEAIHAQAKQGARPELLIFEPDGNTDRPLPLLMAFHGRMGNAADFSQFWRPLTQKGWLVAAAQSSQLGWANAYTWDDWTLARNEARQHYERLSQQYQLDPDRLILGGFSQGGGLVPWLALSGDLPARGFVAVAPFVPDFEAFENQLDDHLHPAGGMIVTGDLDQNQDGFDRLAADLSERGLPVRREKHARLGHAIPDDFDATLERALAFLIDV